MPTPFTRDFGPEGTVENSPRFQPGGWNQSQTVKSREDDAGHSQIIDVFCFEYVLSVVFDVAPLADSTGDYRFVFFSGDDFLP